jgi:EAL domain-containing protein (putative c-di-GMP-specific phosphodiesterase class I)
VAQPLELDGRELKVTASIGIALAPEDGADAEQLMRSADIAMYRMKERGRNGFTFYDPNMGARADERLNFEAELARALERDALRLHFQPKVRFADGSVAGAEALVRWQHPRLGLLPPDRFIAIAEDTGIIVPMGAWILEAACRSAAAWGRSSGTRYSIAVNLSARQFADPGLMADIDRALAKSGLDPRLLELEVTESMVMQEPAQAATLLATLRNRGIRIVMDDFGTGYSSLGYLKRFPFNAVKIDRSFVRDLPHDEDDAAITRAVLAMAKSLRLEVVAEGVERPDQLAFLRREGCTEYQGYHFSVPLADEEFRALLEREGASRSKQA